MTVCMSEPTTTHEKERNIKMKTSNPEIEVRVINTADLIIESRQTVRQIANRIGFCKSTVHNDMTNLLPHIDADRYELVREILRFNKSERHIRGGEATRQRYLREAAK